MIRSAIGGGAVGGGGGGGLFGFENDGVVPFAKGGLITQPTVFPFADGVGLAGEAGTGAIMPLMRGKGGRLGVSVEGTGGNVEIVNQVIIQNNAPDMDVTQSERTDANGQQQLIVSIDQVLAERVGRGEGKLVKALQRNFGLSNSPVSK